MTTQRRLLRWIRALRKRCAARGQTMFMGIPTRWYDDPSWRCRNGHVGANYLSCEEEGDCCLACHERVFLSFPEDTEGPLNARTSRRCRMGRGAVVDVGT